MHERIVVRPTADAFEPGLEQIEFAIPELAIEIFEKKYGYDFFFQHWARKEFDQRHQAKIAARVRFLLLFECAWLHAANLPFAIHAI
jgi:hypothetical protein